MDKNWAYDFDGRIAAATIFWRADFGPGKDFHRLSCE